MSSLLARAKQVIGSAAGTLGALGCAALGSAPRQNPDLAPAWSAWQRGDFEQATAQAERLAESSATADSGRHMLVLVAHITGRYADALDRYAEMSPQYAWLDELDDPVFLSYLHLRDLAGARAFAVKRGLLRRGATREWLELYTQRPMAVTIEGVVEVAFTNDRLTPMMPGFPARLNGCPTVVRLDTGGSFIHLSSQQAALFGVKTVGCERSFAALQQGKVCHGIADLDIGSARLANVPVAVHEGVLPTSQIAEQFGVELGPILGTNVLEQFLSTVETPRRRLLLSGRGNAVARASHLERLPGEAVEVPFVMWGDHIMIARGSVGDRTNLNLFVDSGLIAYADDRGQAALLAPQGTLVAWGASPIGEGMTDLPGPLAMGTAFKERATAFSIPDATWRAFGSWGGIRVDALVSWGYLQRYAWTIDFDRRVYLLGA